MKTDFVPQEVYLKHENEWRALRQAAESRTDIGRAERSEGIHFNAVDLKPDVEQRI
jgi:hypothetical protein